MRERLILRTVAVLVAVLALGFAARAVEAIRSGAPEESGLRLVARFAFAVVLLLGARLAWRRPADADPRLRRRITRLVAVMARPELLAQYAESTPQVEATRAVLFDWEQGFRSAAVHDLARIFEGDEVAALRALDALLREAEAGAPAGGSLAGAWPAVQAAAGRALATLSRSAAGDADAPPA